MAGRRAAGLSYCILLFAFGATAQNVDFTGTVPVTLEYSPTQVLSPKLTSITLEPSPPPALSVGKQSIFKATGNFSDGSTRILGGMGNPMLWHILFQSPQINAQSCGEPALCCQQVAPDASGKFDTTWGANKTVRAVGSINPATIHANLSCVSGPGAGSIDASWNGTFYSGTFTFDNSGTVAVKGLTWSSSNLNVASINDRGIAVGNSAGTAIIRATFGSTCGATLPEVGDCSGSVFAETVLTVEAVTGPRASDPSNLVAIGRSDTQVHVQWAANGNTFFTLDYLGAAYYGSTQPTCNGNVPNHNNIFETNSNQVTISGLQPFTWYYLHVHAIGPGEGGSTNGIVVRTRAAGSGFEPLSPGSPDYFICDNRTTDTGPRVVAGSLPSGVLQGTGESGATDRFSLANIGTDPANVTLTSSGNFFSISPTSFTLQPGGSQSITIAATAQLPGTYDGTITAGGGGSLVVPVRLLVASAPAGSVNPQPTVARVEVTTPAGSVSFRNSGSSAMQGIAVSDVPWIVPQSGLITINPGETKNVSFSIDRSKRADSDSLIGGATGALSLRFFGSPTGSSTGSSAGSIRILGDTTPTSTISVTVVDVVKPGVAPGIAPPLQNNELALFIAGHGSAAGLAGDLFLSNRSPSPIRDLKLFLTGASQVATLPQLNSNLGVTLPSVSNVFAGDGGGSLSLRGTLTNLSAAALRVVNPSGNAAYFSAVPIFRSDYGAGSGGRLVLSGVERSANTRTVVVVQEMAGTSGSADIQAYDANGVAIGAKASLTMGSFVSTADGGDTIVEGARSVVVTNTGSGSSRINAYARVLDNNTTDAWMVVDPFALLRSG